MSMSDRNFISLVMNTDITKIDYVRSILNEHYSKNMIKRKDFVRYHQMLNDRFMRINNINADTHHDRKEKSFYQLIVEVIKSNEKYH